MRRTKQRNTETPKHRNNKVKTYTSLAEIPKRFAFATSNMVLRESDKPAYRAHASYASALNAASKSKTARGILRRAASTPTFAVVL